ncbi:unnamed protein product [Effrenium voratum]|nr:unnamed protein product [Effrenium voratum]
MASLLPALEAKDGELLRPALAKLLKAELGQIELHQTAGERFTGGKSTPVWKLSFVAKRGEKEKETRLVAKWVKPTTDLRRSYVEKQFYLSAAPRVRKFCRLPHMLMCEENPESICFLFDDLTVDFPLHPENLEAAHARASLTWLARFHAYFWEADAAGGSFPAGMSGADYWGPGACSGPTKEGGLRLILARSASLRHVRAVGYWDPTLIHYFGSCSSACRYRASQIYKSGWEPSQHGEGHSEVVTLLGVAHSRMEQWVGGDFVSP